MSGGYVGVDVFFVISGFVITNVIRPDLYAARFSLLNFYERRIRRIFPPLFAMIAVSLVAGWIVMMPDDFKRLGESSVANAVFLQNLYFMKDSGYFNTTAAAKPLLHTWSLGVEEQFYVFLPIYLMLLRKCSNVVAIALTSSVLAFSLMGSVALTKVAPYANFFLLPTRAWELLVGVLLALVPNSWSKGRFSPHGRVGAAVIGIILVGVAVTCYTDDTEFPGIAAIPPVFGAALVILAGSGRNQRVNAWLASRPMAFVGKISYPLYLWHFPIIGFASYLSLRQLDTKEIVAANALIFLCAWASWRFLERPVRERRVFARRNSLFLFGCACVVSTGLAGLAIFFGRGFDARFHGDSLKIVHGMTDRMAEAKRCMGIVPGDVSERQLCTFGEDKASISEVDTLVWGDSHGEALLSGIALSAATAERRFLFAGEYGCALGAHLFDKSLKERTCAEFSEATLNYALSNRAIRRVVLVSRWVAIRDVKRESVDMDASAALEQIVTQLVSAKKSVWLVGPVPDVKADVPRAMYLKLLGFERDFEVRVSEREYHEQQVNVLSFLTRLSGSHDVFSVFPHTALCRGEWCDVEKDGQPLYFDDNHLTTFGARFISWVFDPIFQ